MKETVKNKNTDKHVLRMSDKEILALTDLIDTYSALSESIGDGTAQKDLKIVDKMLLRNGYKRVHN